MNGLKGSLVFLHIAAWLLFMSVPLLFMTQGEPLSNLRGSALLPYLQFCGVYMFIFYFHSNWLIPNFFLPKKHLIYSLFLGLLLAAVFIIKPFDTLMKQNRPNGGQRGEIEMRPPPPGRPPEGEFHRPPQNRDFGPERHFDITSLFIFIMIIGLGSALQSMKQSQLFERRAIQAEAEKVNAELSFLKAQINPHFLYNTLNNIYTLCLTGSENAAESVMKLSHIMRYVTDESEAAFVPLAEELECISNFIALQQLRVGKKVSIVYSVEGNPSKCKIAPLLLMTFIENAFKYGLSNHVETTIRVIIKIVDDKIIFSAENQLFDHKKTPERAGIGIENTKKRLEYLYPKTHQLTITTTEGMYSVLLVLN